MEDFFKILTPNGLSPHNLLLKHNYQIMLLRNLDPLEGLCNSTRLTYRGFDRNFIDIEISARDHAVKIVFIPKTPFLPNSNENTRFLFKQIQFLVKLSFAMMINKS